MLVNNQDTNPIIEPEFNEEEVLESLNREEFAKVGEEMRKGTRILSDVLKEIRKPAEVKNERKDELPEKTAGDVEQPAPEQEGQETKTEPQEQAQEKIITEIDWWGGKEKLELDPESHKILLQQGLKYQYMEKEHGVLQSIVDNLERAGISIDIIQEIIKAKNGDNKAAAKLIKTFGNDISDVYSTFEEVEPIQKKETETTENPEYVSLKNTLTQKYPDTWKQIHDVKKYLPDNVSEQINTNPLYLQIMAEELSSGRFAKTMSKVLPYMQRQDFQFKVSVNPNEFWLLYKAIVEKDMNQQPQTVKENTVKEPTPNVTKKPYGANTQSEKDSETELAQRIADMNPNSKEFLELVAKMKEKAQKRK